MNTNENSDDKIAAKRLTFVLCVCPSNERKRAREEEKSTAEMCAMLAMRQNYDSTYSYIWKFIFINFRMRSNIPIRFAEKSVVAANAEQTNYNALIPIIYNGNEQLNKKAFFLLLRTTFFFFRPISLNIPLQNANSHTRESREKNEFETHKRSAEKCGKK